MTEPHWISADDVTALNRREVAATGEIHGILNRDGLESAIAKPQSLLAYGNDPDTLDMALALLFGLAMNPPLCRATSARRSSQPCCFWNATAI